MPLDSLTAVNIRNQFYHRGQRKLTAVLLLSILTNILLLSTLIYLIDHPPEPRFFATSINGRIVQLYPLTRPNQSDDAMLAWAGQAAVAAFTYNFVNYREELQASSGFFTSEGWQLFLDALKDSNNLIAVQAKSFVVTAAPISPPEILKRGLVNNRYTWRVQIPILVTYQNTTEFIQQSNMVTMMITRVSILNSPRGIGISQFVVSPLSN